MNVPMQKSLILYLCLLNGALQLIANANLRNCILTGMYIYSMLLLFSPPKANKGKEEGRKIMLFLCKDCLPSRGDKLFKIYTFAFNTIFLFHFYLI